MATPDVMKPDRVPIGELIAIREVTEADVRVVPHGLCPGHPGAEPDAVDSHPGHARVAVGSHRHHPEWGNGSKGDNERDGQSEALRPAAWGGGDDDESAEQDREPRAYPNRVGEARAEHRA